MVSAQMIPLTRLANDAESFFRHLGDNAEPLVISLDGRPAAVIQDYERYEKTQQGIELWKTLSYRIRDAEQGNTLSIDEAFEEIETNLAKLEL
jgi:PHD/YefM family antitoxin component YafN of YafNO toxin-antitoxin module